jgi:acetate kinase
VDDYALVLNAGSSSLKFCVFRRPPQQGWVIESKGQIEGIGTGPRLSARNAQGTPLADESLGSDVRDGRGAIDALAVWLRSNYGGSRVLGVGHRVVHGGMNYGHPVIVDRKVLADLYQLNALAPLHQPYNLLAIEAVFDREQIIGLM